MSQLFSIETEQALLSCLLSDNTQFDNVCSTINTDDFAKREHKLIYAAISKLIASHKDADVFTVYEFLVEKGEVDEAGGLQYINAIGTSSAITRSAKRYAEIVKDKAILRNVSKRLSEASELVVGPGTTSEKIDRIAGLLNGIDEPNAQRGPRHISEVVIKVIDSINAAAEGKDKGIPTGIHALDQKLNGGLSPGKMIILAARPAVGKTSLALQIAANCGRLGHDSLVLSQEMLDIELGERMLSNLSDVSYSSLKTGKMTDTEWNRLAEGVDVLPKYHVHVDDEPGLKMTQINARARQIKGLKVLILDYIQLSEGEGDTRSAQVGSISRGLKKLANQLGITVIALSQLNRKVDERPGRRPQMSDLRDSGEIEQDADTIMFLWPLSQDEDESQIRHIGCSIEKNRSGQRGTFVLEFEGGKQRWRESMKRVDDFTTKTRGSFD